MFYRRHRSEINCGNDRRQGEHEGKIRFEFSSAREKEKAPPQACRGSRLHYYSSLSPWSCTRPHQSISQSSQALNYCWPLFINSLYLSRPSLRLDRAPTHPSHPPSSPPSLLTSRARIDLPNNISSTEPASLLSQDLSLYYTIHTYHTYIDHLPTIVTTFV